MSERRRDPTTGNWVIIAPERGARPRHWPTRIARTSPPPAYDPHCPFCPGNETKLAGVIVECRDQGAAIWRTRVVPNKFPVVAGGDGHHEVIIDHPRHDRDLTEMDDDDVFAIVRTYRDRYAAMARDAAIQSITVFRNHGAAAGASLQHPHSQLIALGFVPPLTLLRHATARRHHDETGHCILCDMIRHERADGARVIVETDEWLSIVPFAASAPYETWLLPKRHAGDLLQCAANELASLAKVLRRMLDALNAALDDPPYNVVFDCARSRAGEAEAHHWKLRIVPELTIPAGFELGTGVHVNPSLPERDAERLRTARDT